MSTPKDDPDGPPTFGAGGDALWDALGASEDPPLPEGFDERFRRALASDVREEVGDELWDVLGAASVPSPGPPDVAAVRRAAAGRWWLRPALAIAAVALVAIGLAVRPEDTDPALIAELDFAMELDLVADPDFDLLLKWDGEAP